MHKLPRTQRQITDHTPVGQWSVKGLRQHAVLSTFSLDSLLRISLPVLCLCFEFLRLGLQLLQLLLQALRNFFPSLNLSQHSDGNKCGERERESGVWYVRADAHTLRSAR